MFRFDICGSVSESIFDNRYGVSNGEFIGGCYVVVCYVGELDDILYMVWGIICYWLFVSGEKMCKVSILFYYINFVEGVIE